MGVKLSWHAGGKAAVTSLTSTLLLAEAELLLFIMVYLTLTRRKCLLNRAVASSLTQADWNKKEDLMLELLTDRMSQKTGVGSHWTLRSRRMQPTFPALGAPLLHQRDNGAPVRMQLSRETVYTPADESLRSLPQSCTVSQEPSDRTCSTEIFSTMFSECLLSLVNYETHEKKGSNGIRKSTSLHKCWILHIDS